MRQILDKPTYSRLDRSMAKQKLSASPSPKWDKEMKAAFQAADGSKRILNKYFGSLSQVSEKFQAGLVSEADRESEKYIIKSLKQKFSSHEFLGEETGLSKASIKGTKVGNQRDSVFQWVIDPLDGTTNYVHQFPYFCISIALRVNGVVVLGVVDAPKMKMRFHAVRGHGAFLNGKKIKVSDRKTIHEGLFATGFSDQDNELDKQLKLCSHVVKKGRGLRRAGAAALDLCFVASGVFDLFWEKNLKPWDTAAGSLIALEAGAIVSNLNNDKYEIDMHHVVAGTPKIHREFMKLYSEI